MAHAPPSDFQKLAELEEEQNKIRDILFFQSIHGVSQSNTFGQGRKSTALGSKLGGESWFPLEAAITDIDLNDIATGIFDKLNLQSLANVVVGPVGTLILKTIQHVADGKIFSVTPGTGRVVEITPGGNIDVSSTVTLQDTDMAFMQFFKDTNKVKLITGGTGGGGGANVNLSNLVSTAVNTNILPDTNVMWDLGSALLSWANLWVSAIRFDDDEAAPTGASPDKISTGLVSTIPVMHFNVKAAISNFDFYHLGVIGMSIFKNAAGQILIDPDIVTIGDSAQFQPKTAAPAINGVMALDSTATDVRVFSGGALRNMSDIGSGGGATRELDNLLVTSINADLLFANPNLDIGTLGTPLDSLNAKRITMITGGALITGATMIRNFAGDMQFNVPLNTDRYEFKWIGVNDVSISFNGTSSKIDVDDVNAGLQLTLQPVATNPAIDGIMRHITGGDVKVFSGGVLKNFSQMPQLDGPNTFIGINSFIGVSFSVNSANIFLGDSTSDNIFFTARLGGNLIPSTDDARKLGESGLTFAEVHSQKGFFPNRLKIPVGTNMFD